MPSNYYGLPYEEKLKCRECGRVKPSNYFISRTLCKKCAAKRRRAISNTPVQITEGLIVTETVRRRLAKEAEVKIPRTTIDAILHRVQQFIFLLFWASDIPIANSLFELFSGPWWIFTVGWCLFLPMGIAWVIDVIMAKPRKERMAKISEMTRELAKLRKERIEQQKQFYSSPEWAMLRTQVIKEEEHVCASCGKKIREQDDITVDHIKPRSKYPELAFDRQNLQVLCRKCNSSKRDKDLI